MAADQLVKENRQVMPELVGQLAPDLHYVFGLNLVTLAWMLLVYSTRVVYILKL